MVYVRFDKEKKVWNQIPPSEKRQDDVKLEERLLKVLDHVKLDLHKDRDIGIIIFGGVGSGKSTLGRLCCRYVSNEKFHPKTHMVRDVNDIARVMRKAKKYEGIVFDEASGIFGSADTNTKKTKYAQLVLDVCRQKNLFLVIIAPQFHRLTAPVAIDRTTFALRTFFHKKDNRRGKFCFYGNKAKGALYEHAKKNHGKLNLPRLKKWHGEFGEDNLFDEEYRKIKDETLNLVLDSFEKPKQKQPTPEEIKKQTMKDLAIKNHDKTVKELASMLGVNERTIHRWKKEFKDRLVRENLIKVYTNTNEKAILTATPY
jgi:ABC-type oligopeptide transport system ATPase subunit